MKNRYVLLIDLPLIAVAAFGAFAARFDFRFYETRPEFLLYLWAALAIKPVVFFLMGMYRRYWRYASVQELMLVTLAVSASSAVMSLAVLLAFLLNFSWGFSRVVLFNDWLLTLVAVGGFRLAIRLVNDSSVPKRRAGGGRTARRVLIVGAGAAGTMVAREMRRNPQLGMEPVGFLDDDDRKVGKNVAGLTVLGKTESLPQVAAASRVENVIIAMPTARGRVVRAILEMCTAAGIESQTMPGVFELLDGQVSVRRLRHVDIADLLRRAQVTPSQNSSAYVAGRTVAVTGAGGSIGFELCRQLAHASPKCLLLLGHGENSIFEAECRLRESFPSISTRRVIADVRDVKRIGRIFDEFHPEIVFHAAAHKHVPLMEENPEEAATNNILGTLHVVEAAVRCGAQRLVMISTDKAVSPTSLMGASKRLAEMIVRDAAKVHNRAFAVVRFGNVLDSRGSVIPVFKRQIERGGPITLTHPDMKRFFMTIPEAVHLVLEAGGMASRGELFALNMGEPVKIADLAADLVRLSGLLPGDIPVVFTGVRPGEKLTESLWEAEAVTEPTANPDVLRVLEPTGIESDSLASELDVLRHAIERGDILTIQAVLAQCIPTFTPALPTDTAPARTV
jgi:FlaA1/EpsC-like NDP-sugar epimerase